MNLKETDSVVENTPGKKIYVDVDDVVSKTTDTYLHLPSR